MKQLKMCYLRRAPTPIFCPKELTVKNYDKEEEKSKYLQCYRKDMSNLSEDEVKWFDLNIERYRDCNPKTDTFFVLDGDEYVAAVTAISHPAKQGYVHMVGVRQDYRGKGLSNLLLYLALDKLYKQGAKRVILTTTDDRIAALKCYLRAGFYPMVNGFGYRNKTNAVERWKIILRNFGHKKYDMYSAFGRKFELFIGE